MKVKVLLVIPGKEVQTIKIPGDMKFIKSFIGDELYRFSLSENIEILSNKNAKFDEFNRLFRGNIILGTFIIVSTKNNHLISMKNKDIRRYTNIFKLRKHERKVNMYKDEFLEEYYFNKRKTKQENINKKIIKNFLIAA